MKENRFKAWDKQNSKMVEPDGLFIFTGAEVLILNPHHVDTTYYQIDNAEDRFVQLRFSGLADRKGIYVWEGQLRMYKGRKYKVVDEVWRFSLERNMVEFGDNERIEIGEDVAHESMIISQYYLSNPDLLKQ